ncbi:MAG TPA: hypothetical protein VJO34_09180 [Methylomirabilota bacterium]|nr:hypothetical protein [Methylomirabilota bacterium]
MNRKGVGGRGSGVRRAARLLKLGSLVVLILLLSPETGAAQGLPVRGFLQGAVSGRVGDPEPCPTSQARACRENFLIGEERLQLELSRSWGWIGAAGKLDLFHDAVDNEADVDLREVYLDLRHGIVDLRIGRQILTWGVGDLVFINDVFPKDRVAFISGFPLEYLKKGSDGVSVTLSHALASLQLVFVPHFRPDTFPEAGGRLRFFDPFGAITARHTDEPSPSVDTTEIAGRLFRTLFGWDLALYAYRGFFHLPSLEMESGPTLRFFFPRLYAYGASAQGNILNGVASVELGFYDSEQDRSGTNAGIENSQFRYLLGYQREIRPDLTVGFQYYGELMLEHDRYRAALPPGVPPKAAVRHVLTARLTQLLLHQTLRLGLFGLWSPNEGDLFFNPEVKYNVTDNLWAAVGGNFFVGSAHTEFGQFEGNTNLYAVVRYAF